MRKLLRKMAKVEMAQKGYTKINRRMDRGRWRAIVGAYPVNLVTGAAMKKGFVGRKKYNHGHRSHLFAY